MTTFDEREKGQEAQLAHDEDLRFQGLRAPQSVAWPLGRRKARCSGPGRRGLRNTLIQAHLEGNGDEAVFAKLRADFGAAGLPQSDHQIHREMAELLAKATKDVIAGTSQAH